MNPNIPTPVVVPERRPMFTRDWNLSKQLTRGLVAKRVPPNMISLVGMAGAVVAGLALAATSLSPWPQAMYLLAVAGIIVRGMGNLLDGMVAVESGKASPLGELFNEVPDRVSDIAILVGAGWAAGGNATLGLLAALVAVLVAYVRAEGKVTGAAQHYCGPMAKPGRMVVIVVISAYCGLTPASWQPAASFGNHQFGLMAIGLAIIVGGGIVTIIRRLKKIARDVSTLHYPVKK
jgi:phosphatidylglycerophosphate synthase